MEAVCVEGDPLPVQFRFLTSATALKELSLEFCYSFWRLPSESCLAMRGALSRLSSLKVVSLLISRTARDEQLMHLHAPLSVFAAAKSIEHLYFSWNEPPPKHYHRPHPFLLQGDCFSALTKLRGLILIPPPTTARDMPDAAKLLEGLPSTQLTSLYMREAIATRQLMEHISRFRDLQDLWLHFEWASLNFLDPLCGLSCLTKLILYVDKLRDHHGDAASAIHSQALRLESTIHESARRVGVKAIVVFNGLQ
jgi:hypothetical protein